MADIAAMLAELPRLAGYDDPQWIGRGRVR